MQRPTALRTGALTLMFVVLSGAAFAQPAAKGATTSAPPACTLLTRADVQKAIGRDPQEKGVETSYPPGTACELGPARLFVFSSATAWKDYEAMLKQEKRDKHPRQDVAGIGDRAFVMFLKAENQYQRDTALMAMQSGRHLLQLSLYAPKGKPADSMQAPLTELAKVVIAKLP